MLNSISLMGRMVKDPELRTTAGGTPVCSFTLAVDRDIDRTQVDFIDCVAWNKAGEFVANHFHKGEAAVVVGRLQIRERTDKDGNKRRNAEVVAGSIYFGSGGNAKKDSDKEGKDMFRPVEDEDGDLPF